MQALRSVIRSQVRFLLKESSYNPKGNALALFEHDTENYAVLYDPTAMRKALKDLSDLQNVKEMMSDAILGMIEYAPASTGNCHGAYEILKSAVKDKGKGIGSFLYSIVMSAAPSKTIMSDRRSVSDDAEKMWKSMKNKAKSLKFDNENNPVTDDPEDDCMLNDKLRSSLKHEEDPVEDADYLNHAYKGSSSFEVGSMVNLHKDIMEEVSFELDDPEKLLRTAAIEFFRRHQ